MKKIYFSAFLLASLASNAQIFSEDFASGIPSDWTVIDVDNSALNTNANNVTTKGWFGTQGIALNTSWYATAGAMSDDWIMTPQITIPASATNPTFIYYAQTASNSVVNTYNVLISTTGTNTADFTALATGLTTATSGIKTVDLTAYAGQTVHMAIQDNTTGVNHFILDDVSVEDLPSTEISLVDVAYNKFVEAPNTQSLDIVVQNKGKNPITAYTVKWNYGGNPYSYDVTGVNLGYNEFHNQTINLDVTVSTAVKVDFDVEIELVDDADVTNNADDGSIYGLSEVAQKIVFFEEATGAWCGWCPRGAVGLDNISAGEGENVVGIAVHNGDPMAVAEHDNNMDVSGYPSANGDRKEKRFDPGNFQEKYDILKNNISPVDLSISATYDAGTNEVTVNTSATFKTDMATSDYSISVIAVEDWVHGTSSAYNQTNYYAGGGNGVMGGYESLSNPVPAADMYYRHVSRGFVNGGFSGDATVIPTTIVSGTEYTKEYTYSVPSSVAIGHLHFAVIIIDNETKEVLNANKAHSIQNVVGVEEFSSEFSLTPNPANDVFTLKSSTNVEGTVRIVNTLGQVMDTYVNNTLFSGSTYDVSKYEAGIYYVTITEGNKIATKRLVIE